MHPWQFLREFVEPAVAEWHSDPLNIRRVTIALADLDNLAEHFIRHAHPGLKQKEIRRTREALCSLSTQAVIARDVHDTHKHGPLGRSTATMKQGQRPKASLRDPAFSDAFQRDAFQTGTPALVITQDDGIEHFAEDVIYALLRHWHSELSKKA